MPLWRQYSSPVRVPCSLLRDGTTHPTPIVLNPASLAGVLLAGSDPLRAYRVVSTDLAAADGQVVLHERADRDRGGNRTVGNPCRSRSPYLPGRSKLWDLRAADTAAQIGGSHRRGRTAWSDRTRHSSDYLPIRSVTTGSGSDVRTTKSAHIHQASSVEIGFRAAIWTGLPITGRPAGHRRAIQRSFAIRAMVTASP
jgi:hypothetical protein